MTTAKESMRKINQQIGTIKKSKVQEVIHKCAIDIMNHAVEYGDYSAINRLKAVIPEGIRISDFNTWVVSHTPLNWDKKEGKYKKTSKREWLIADADAKPFWVFTKDKEEIEKPLDAAEGLAKVIENFKKKVAKAQDEGKEVTNLEGFNNLVAKLQIKADA